MRGSQVRFLPGSPKQQLAASNQHLAFPRKALLIRHELLGQPAEKRYLNCECSACDISAGPSTEVVSENPHRKMENENCPQVREQNGMRFSFPKSRNDVGGYDARAKERGHQLCAKICIGYINDQQHGHSDYCQADADVPRVVDNARPPALMLGHYPAFSTYTAVPYANTSVTPCMTSVAS